MKKIYIGFILISASFQAFSQANAVIFSENGEKFTAYLNGEPQNEQSKSNVKVSGLTAEFYQLRVDFEDTSLADFSNSQFAVAAGTETTYVIKMNKKGEYVCRFQGQVPFTAATATTQPDNSIKDYAIVDDEADETKSLNTNSTAVKANVGGNSSTTVVKETTTTSTHPQGKTEGVSINMNVDGVNMGVDMKVDGMEMETNEIQHSTTVTTTTTTTNTNVNSASQVNTPTPKPREEVVIVENNQHCTRPMDQAAFASAKKSAADKGFDEIRLSQAKQITKANCLTSAQIKDMMGAFGFEDTMLAYAKYAYDYCYDPNNYYTVNDAFGFSSSVDELNEYIDSK